MSMLSENLAPKRRAHLVGIGGVSMSALAEVLQRRGLIVTGSDMQEGAAIEDLRELGIPIRIGHRAENIAGADFIVRTAAVHDDNPEIAEARRRSLPVYERAEVWGELMSVYKNALCVAGAHGKTTTTSMCTHILLEAKADPTVMIGGYLPILGSGHRAGHGDTIVMESCEYCNSFLHFLPTIALITNIDADHLDFFKDLDDIKSSFRRFASLVPKLRGTVLINADDKNSLDAMEGIDRRLVTYGFKNKADIQGRNLKDGEFDVYEEERFFTHIKIQVPGEYNAYNALAAATGCMALNISADAITAGLAAFTGAGRRFEYKGTVNGAKVYDDYAHHPKEVKAVLTMAKTLGCKRVICAFQSHTYTRTKALFPEFVEALSIADKAFIADIYAAREQNTVGVSGADLAAAVKNAEFYPKLAQISGRLLEFAAPGDLVITIGAGDIYKVADMVTSEWYE